MVFRLATSHSVEGKMLRRACDKMALERLVIKKGVFKEVLDVSGSNAVRAHGGVQHRLFGGGGGNTQGTPEVSCSEGVLKCPLAAASAAPVRGTQSAAAEK